MRKKTFLCIIVLVVFVVGCSMSRDDLFDLASTTNPNDVPDLYPEIVIKSATGMILPVDYKYPFPSTEINTFMAQTFVIENTGNADLVIGNIIFIDVVTSSVITEFSISDPPSSIVLPGESTTFDVMFTTSIEGSIEGLMVIGSNDVPYAYVIFLKVTATPATSFEPAIDVMIGLLPVNSGYTHFITPDTPVGEFSVITVTISNEFGTEDLIVDNILVTGKPGVFVLPEVSYPIIVSPLGSTIFQVEFHPDDYKTYTTKLKINSNDPDELETSFTINLIGNGI